MIILQKTLNVQADVKHIVVVIIIIMVSGQSKMQLASALGGLQLKLS